MHSVDLYRTILPDAARLRALNEAEMTASADLLVALAQLAGLPRDSSDYEDLQQSWLDLFCAQDLLARATLLAHLEQADARVRALFEYPQALSVLLTSACSRLRDPLTQFHVFCLFAVTACLCGAHEPQLELCDRIGRKFNMPEARIEELFARMASATQRAHPDKRAVDLSPEYLVNAQWQRQAVSMHADTNPFELPRR